MSIKVLIADDHKIIRDGLISLISSEDDMEVVAEAGNGKDAVSLARQHHPDIVVMDINMPGLNGMDATKIILDEQPDIKIIALSIHTTRKFVRQMLHAGVKGYLVKHCAYEELSSAIQKVMKNEFFFSAQIVGTVIEDYTKNFPVDNKSIFSQLSTREREVLQLVAEGLSSDDIADRLFISKKTVSSHRRQIMNKLNLKNVAEMTRYAISEGLISSDF